MKLFSLRTLIWGLIFLAAVLLYLYFYLYSEIKVRSGEAVDLYQKVEEERNRKLDEVEAKELLRSTAASRKTLDSYFIKKENNLAFVEVLEDLGRKTKIDFSVTGANPSKDNLTLSFEAAGTFQDLNHFLVLVEEMPYYVRPTDIYFSSDSGEQKKGPPLWKLTGSLRVVGYIPE